MHLRQFALCLVSVFGIASASVIGCVYTPPTDDPGAQYSDPSNNDGSVSTCVAGQACAAGFTCTDSKGQDLESACGVCVIVNTATSCAGSSSQDAGTDSAVVTVLDSSADTNVSTVDSGELDAGITDAGTDSADASDASNGPGTFTVTWDPNGSATHSYTVYIGSQSHLAGDPIWGSPIYLSSGTHTFTVSVNASEPSVLVVQGFYDPAFPDDWTHQMCDPGTLTVSPGVSASFDQQTLVQPNVISNGHSGCNLIFHMNAVSDGGTVDAGSDASLDAGLDAALDAMSDASFDASDATAVDASPDASVLDASTVDASDAGSVVVVDASPDAAMNDAGTDSGTIVIIDAGSDVSDANDDVVTISVDAAIPDANDAMSDAADAAPDATDAQATDASDAATLSDASDAGSDAAPDAQLVDAATDANDAAVVIDAALNSDGSGSFELVVSPGGSSPHTFTVYMSSSSGHPSEPTWGNPVFTQTALVFDQQVKAFPGSDFIVQGYWDPSFANDWTHQMCNPSALTLATSVTGTFQGQSLTPSVISNGQGGCNVLFVMPAAH